MNNQRIAKDLQQQFFAAFVIWEIAILLGKYQSPSTWGLAVFGFTFLSNAFTFPELMNGPNGWLHIKNGVAYLGWFCISIATFVFAMRLFT